MEALTRAKVGAVTPEIAREIVNAIWPGV
jgi:hypothetical protein